MLASFGMALRYSFPMGREADMLDQAIAAALAKGLRTADIVAASEKAVSTADMGEAVLTEFAGLAG
jgi:3-isopropylmalate dehydrogenase